jgi:oligopeptide transport system substrate-binding protein
MVFFRKLFPYMALLLAGAAVVWAANLGTLPPADFAFINGTEVQSVDPSKITGAPEGRVVDGLFEGLYRSMPAKDNPTDLVPRPGVASGHALSEDGRTYTFAIRPDARWSDGTRVTAHDFVWSWRRTLHPETASQYAYQLYYILHAARYNGSKLEVGDRVEVELTDRPDVTQNFPRGTIVSGILLGIDKPPPPALPDSASGEAREKADEAWKLKWRYVVEVKPEREDSVAWDEPGETQSFVVVRYGARPAHEASVVPCLRVLPHFSIVGVHAADDDTLVVTLENPTPYFLDLVAFYPLYPVQRACIERHGYPNWTKEENIVGNGAYTLGFRRLRDRIRLVKNPHYWDAANVQLETIDALAVNSETTGLNMYMSGQVDWITTVPSTVIPDLMARDDFDPKPILVTYYYRCNVKFGPLKDKRVRQALNAAIDKQLVCTAVTRAGQQPARSFVPPGLPDYVPAMTGAFDAAHARKLLADAGYPDGRGFPRVQIIFNTHQGHRDIAEVIGRQWRNHLGIDVDLRNVEWGVFLDTLDQKNYQVARSAWVGDYPDPNTFLDMFVTDGANNQTNWSNARYDELIASAAAERDTARRLELLTEAEGILMDELPILPIYYYVSTNMVRPYVEGFYPNIQDKHPLNALRIDPARKQAFLEREGWR